MNDNLKAVKVNWEWCCPHCKTPLKAYEKIETNNDVQKYRCEFCKRECFINKMFEEVKNIVFGWMEDNEEFEKITPETEILKLLNERGDYQICDIIDDMQEQYDVVFTVADIVSCLKKKLEN